MSNSIPPNFIGKRRYFCAFFYDYKNTSTTKIIEQVKIAKGSFNQYFEDRKELYLYLVDLASQAKIAFLQQAKPPESKMEFFPYLRWLFDVETQFDLTHPTLTQIVYRLKLC